MNGLVFNRKRIFWYGVLALVGLILIMNGIIGYYYTTEKFQNNMTDAQIIERAKALGYVDFKEQLEEESNE